MNEFRIPFANPAMSEASAEAASGAIKEVLLNGHLSNGEYNRKLEEKVAKISGADMAITCSSCSQGLIAALAGAQVAMLGERDRRIKESRDQMVIGFTSSFTWNSTIAAINAQGCPVYYMDIDYDSWCVKEYPMGKGPAFALAVDTFGTQFAAQSPVPIFYDRAHSLGQRFRHIGMASVLSLSPSKLITGCEGGIILTNSPKFGKAYTMTRDLISRLSEPHAIIALENLKKLPEILEWKKGTYDYYKSHFPSFQFQQGESNHQVIGMLVDTKKQRDGLYDYAISQGLEVKAYYKPTHLQTSGYDWAGKLPITEDIASRIIVLPSWLNCPREEVVNIIKDGVDIVQRMKS